MARRGVVVCDVTCPARRRVGDGLDLPPVAWRGLPRPLLLFIVRLRLPRVGAIVLRERHRVLLVFEPCVDHTPATVLCLSRHGASWNRILVGVDPTRVEPRAFIHLKADRWVGGHGKEQICPGHFRTIRALCCGTLSKINVTLQK